MGLIDKGIDWYIHNILTRKVEDYNSPGMLFVKFNSPSGQVFSRIVLIPESILARFEDIIVEKNGLDGEKLLYLIGKKSGYNIGQVFQAPQYSEKNAKSTMMYLEFIMKFNFSTWARGGDLLEKDGEKKKFVVRYKGHIVCSKNGKGYMLTQGIDTGFLSYLMNDLSLEGTQIRCEGRQDEECEEIVATKEYFDSTNTSFIDLQSVPLEIAKEQNQYKKFNEKRTCKFAKYSLKQLITSKKFILDNRIITYSNLRFVNISDIFLYVLENLLEHGEMKDWLYQISFEEGQGVIDIHDLNSVTNLVSALGWGDLIVRQEKSDIFFYLDLFPWRVLEKDISDFSLVSGFISGMVSKVLKKEVKLRKIEKGYHDNRFSLKIS